jgi:hypothetical protein
MQDKLRSCFRRYIARFRSLRLSTASIEWHEMSRRSWIIAESEGHGVYATVHYSFSLSNPCELKSGRITRLSVVRLSDNKEVAKFHRCWHVPPMTQTAKRVVKTLVESLKTDVLNRLEN